MAMTDRLPIFVPLLTKENRINIIDLPQQSELFNLLRPLSHVVGEDIKIPAWIREPERISDHILKESGIYFENPEVILAR